MNIGVALIRLRRENKKSARRGASPSRRSKALYSPRPVHGGGLFGCWDCTRRPRRVKGQFLERPAHQSERVHAPALGTAELKARSGHQVAARKLAPTVLASAPQIAPDRSAVASRHGFAPLSRYFASAMPSLSNALLIFGTAFSSTVCGTVHQCFMRPDCCAARSPTT